jgi:hypothetical protein
MKGIGYRAAGVALLAVGLVDGWTIAAGAEPKTEATVELRSGPVGVYGVVNFELAGGPVNGAIRLINVPYVGTSLLKLSDGRMVAATLSGKVSLSGWHGGGPLSSMEGPIVLNGTFTRTDTGCSSVVGGEGTWLGRLDGLLGILLIDAYWPAVAYQGCGAASPDEFRVWLPRLRFAPLLAAPRPPA